ncbi:MAG: polysaccharide deacetylase family protein [Chitinophagaceae bacterium]|nr:MAG: polysaccharide deacetylase family protein [Chitinophagaceae bacterium]
MFYLVKTPLLFKKLFPKRIWEIATDKKEIFLTFDDGPHPEQTTFVLDELRKYNAKATFFCIGKNVVEQPAIYRQILEEGHCVGNHTHNHLNAWKVDDRAYLENIKLATGYIDSNLFRPPYGKINSFLVKQLASPAYQLRTIMWTILSGDFDTKISKERCLENVLLHAKGGSIVVFHDSEKAQERMRFALPAVLKYFSEKGFVFSSLENQNGV